LFYKNILIIYSEITLVYRNIKTLFIDK